MSCNLCRTIIICVIASLIRFTPRNANHQRRFLRCCAPTTHRQSHFDTNQFSFHWRLVRHALPNTIRDARRALANHNSNTQNFARTRKRKQFFLFSQQSTFKITFSVCNCVAVSLSLSFSRSEFGLITAHVGMKSSSLLRTMRHSQDACGGKLCCRQFLCRQVFCPRILLLCV